MLTTPNLDATGHRWVSALAGFNFKLEYLCSTDNRVADVLSRMENRLTDEVTSEFLQSLDESSYDAKGIGNNTEKGTQPLTKVKKDAVNEIMERVPSVIFHMLRLTTRPSLPNTKSLRRS